MIFNINEETEKTCKKLIELFAENNICLQFDDQHKKLRLDTYTIYYSSKLSAIQTLEEVFINMAYYFYIDKNNPLIIDAGSEVGIATIFFKIFYPAAKILCFEAHPYAVELLKKNIKINKLTNVTIINAALTNTEGEIDFFGEFDLVDNELDTRGCSIIDDWGLQRETSKISKVPAVKLSKYITHEVDYLKLNIEGAEQKVLEDLEATGKMKLIDIMLLKFHHSPKINHLNNLDYTLWLLSKNRFVINKKNKKDPSRIFPGVTKGWAAETGLCVYTITTQRIKNREKKPRYYADKLPQKLYLLRKTLLEKETFLLRNVINNVPSSIYWKNKDGYYLGHNDYAIQKLHDTNIAPDVTLKNIIGKSDYDIFSREAADKYRKNDLFIMESKKPLILEENIKTPEGKDLFQLSSKQPLYNEKMRVVGIIGSTVDITDYKKSILLQKEMVEKINKALEMLSGNIAHEIKTPLSIINICSDNLDIELKKLFTCSTNSQQKKIINSFIKNIKTTVYNAETIISMLLVKIQNMFGKVNYDFKNLKVESIKESINNAINEYPFRENEYKLVHFDYPDKDFNYQGDQLFIKHILFNLIKNSLWAIKESDKGEIYISLRTDKDHNYVIFRDTAAGISADKIDYIFEQFDSSKKEGSGLGLPFCKMAMQLSGGNITCNSKEGDYTEFTLHFPRI